MRQLLLIMFSALLVSPAFAQDIDLGLGGDVGSLLNIPAPRGTRAARGPAPGGRGGPAARGAAPNAPSVDRLLRLRELLAQANMPLSKEQESGLNALLDAEVPAMRQALQKRVQELQKVKSGDEPSPGALPSMEELTPEIIRLNDQLLGNISEATLLSSEQRELVKKLYKDQVKSRGGFDAIKLTMDDAGAPFSPEQIAQIQPLFDQQNEARLQLVRDAQGQPPDKAKLDQLQRDTLAKLLKLLTAPQRAALLTK